MTKQILKTVLAGILAGTVVFFVPFILSLVLFFFILKTIFRLLWDGNRSNYRKHMHFVYEAKADTMHEDSTTERMHPFGNFLRYNK